MGGRYDNLCAEDSKAVNDPLDKALTSDSLQGLALTKPGTFAAGEDDRSHAQNANNTKLSYHTGQRLATHYCLPGLSFSIRIPA